MNKLLTLLISLIWISLSTKAQTAMFTEDDGYGNGTQNMTGQRWKEWDTNLFQWTDKDSFTLVYNTQKQILRKNLFQLKNNQWTLINYEGKSYDAMGRLLSDTLRQVPLSAGNLLTLYTYSASGKETLVQNKEYNAASNSWINKQRSVISYTSFDSINTGLIEIYTAGAWQNAIRYIHTYNTQQKDSIVSREIWNSSTNQWTPHSRYLYTYAGNGLVSTETQQTHSNAVYTNVDKKIFSYNINNKLIVDLYQKWVNGVWKNDYRRTLTYNTQGSLTHVLMELWSGSQNGFENYGQTFYVYDANNRLIESTMQGWINNAWLNTQNSIYSRDNNGYHKTLVVELWDTNLNTWRNFRSFNFWYTTNQSTATHDVNIPEFSLYPNPCNSSQFTLVSEEDQTYRVYSLSGNMLQHGRIRKGINTILCNLHPGNYIIQVGLSAMQFTKE